MQQALASKGRVLVVDDESAVVESHALLLTEIGYEPVVRTDPERVWEDLEAYADIDVILLDIRMPQIDGLDLLRQIKARRPDIGVIIITVVTDYRQAVIAIKEGAFAYLDKPVTLERLDQELTRYYASCPKRLLRDPRFASVVTRSPALETLFVRIQSLAEEDVPVLIEGETGTGKELVAHLFHTLSVRRLERYIPVNVSALSGDLFGAEFFGHCRGAFTGAARDHAGYLGDTGKGTLFLDEIGDLDLEHQKKLLRVLVTRRYMRVGETVEREFLGRIVMATNHDLSLDVQRGRFRKDLYYRLVAHRVAIPPLRERPEDIELLADYFLRKFSAHYNAGVKQFSPEAIAFLNQHRFPGNVRELEGMISNAIIVEKGPILHPAALQYHPPEGEATRDEPTYDLRQARERLIQEALTVCDGNILMAAKKLGVSRNTVKRFLKKVSSDSLPL